LVSRFTYQEGAVPAASSDCIEAARRTLVEMRSKPVVDGMRVRADVGSLLKTRFLGALFVPEWWLPIRVTVDVLEAGGQRQVSVNVAERFGIGTIFGMETKYRAHCQRTGAYVRDAIAGRLATSHQLLLFGPE
jgi:hypothetical protein